MSDATNIKAGKVSIATRMRSAIAVLIGAAAAVPSPKSSVGGGMMPGGRMGYARARGMRSDAGWRPGGYGPNANSEAAVGGAVDVRASVRELADTDELIDGGVDAVVEAVVRTGIGIKAKTAWPELNAQIDAVLDWASGRVDSERSMGLAESQSLFLRELLIAGEVGVHLPMAEAVAGAYVGSGWPMMPAVDLICAERLPIGLHAGEKAAPGFLRGMLGGVEPGEVPAGHSVRSGVETDAQNRVVAYHVLPEHPADGGTFRLFSGKQTCLRIDATTLEWCFVSREAEQIRGVPSLMTALNTARMAENLVADAFTQTRSGAAFGLICEMPAGSVMPTSSEKDDNGQPREYFAVDGAGQPVNRVVAGQMNFVKHGTKVTVTQPTLPGPDLADSEAVLNRKKARALRVPYSTLSGDQTRENFASMRGGELAARRGYRQRQKFVFDHHTSPWAAEVVRWAVLMGRVSLTAEQARALTTEPHRVLAFTAQYPGFDYVSPFDEGRTDDLAIENGTKSAIEVIGERGRDWRQTNAERVEFAVDFRQRLAAANMTVEEYTALMLAGKGGAATAYAKQPSADQQNDANSGGKAGGDVRPAPGKQTKSEAA